MITTPNQCQQAATMQHFRNANASAVHGLLETLAEGVALIQPEATLGTDA